jgi:tetratricopeptide (TPR) repeat protein
LLGTILDAQKRFDEAEEIYSRALRISPDSPSLWNNLGNHYAMRGQLDRARTAYLHVVGIDPHHANADLHLAQMSIAQKEGQEALRYLDNLPEPDHSSPTAQLLRAKALHLCGKQAASFVVLDKLEKHYAKSVPVTFSVGVTYAEWGRYDDAERVFTKVLAIRPSDVDVLYNLGLATTRAGHMPRAEEAFQSVLKQRPDDVDALNDLARVYIMAGQSERAVDLLNQAITIDPNLLPARYARAMLNYKAGRAGDSLNDLTFVLARNSKDYRALDLQGQAQIALNQDKVAISSFRQAADLAPNDPWVLMHYSRALLRVDQKEEAKAVLDKLGQMGVKSKPSTLFALTGVHPSDEATHSIADLERQVRANPEDADSRARLAEAQLVSGQTKEALANFDKLLEVMPGVPILSGCAKALLESQQYPEARKFLEKALGFPNSPPEVRLEFATALFYTNSAEAALASLERTPDAERQGDWYLLAAKFLGSMGRDREAIADLNQGLSASPHRPDLCFEAARFLLNHAHYHEAFDLLGKAVCIFPEDPKLRLSQAIAYSFMERSEDSERLLAEIELRWPDWSRPYLVNGIILVELHRLAEAKPLIEAAIVLGDTNALAYFNLALADLDSYPRDANGAQEAISRAVRLAPEDPYVQWLAGKVSYIQKDYQGAIEHLQAALHSWPDMVEAHIQLSAAYKAVGDKGKSVAELKAVSRIKESKRGAVQTPPRPASSTEDLLMSVHPPE